jgi:lipocalin
MSGVQGQFKKKGRGFSNYRWKGIEGGARFAVERCRDASLWPSFFGPNLTFRAADEARP